MRRAGAWALAAAGAVVGAALWWRTHPSACPYGQRFWVQAPHPFITRERLREALAPAPGETILEVGPGTGYYTLEAAGWIAPGGTLHILDLQPAMVDHVVRAAAAAGVENIVPRAGDARSLPYGDADFDAAFLITTLGEVPDQAQALRELARVLKPGGRLVVGELFGDPHMVRESALRARAAAAGLEFEQRIGPPFGYFGVLRRPA